MAFDQLQDEAARVLLSTELEDKLVFASEWTDDAPRGTAALPSTPGRPAALRLSKETAPFPGGALETPRARRRALHFFANHELLALEIMALMLLRFPDAPAALRRALAVTLQEEQLHLQLYIDRIRALGGEFGEDPVNGFFWRCFRELDDLPAYFAGMSLTFEQANLDFSAEFRDRFRAVQDEASAQLMQRVLDDEIKHVRLGRVWLQKQARQSDLWRAYIDSLPAPLSARRARGRRMAWAPRKRAGLPDEFIERIAMASESRGRVPDCWSLGPMDRSAVARGVARDLAPLAALLARPDDWVFVERMPSLELRRAWLKAGLEPRELTSSPSGRRARRWRGWGVEAPPDVDWQTPPGPPPRWASKRFGLRLAIRLAREQRSALLASPGRWCERLDDVIRATEALAPDQARWKSPMGTAGRGQRRVRGPSDADLRWAQRIIDSQGGLLVEAQQEVLLELSLDPRGGEPLIARVDRQGRFVGHELQGGPRALAALFGRRTARALSLLRAAETLVASTLSACGHHELSAIDALVVRRRDGSLALRLPSEVNVRPSFGHIARRLKHHVAPRARAAHFVISSADARRRGFEGLEALAEAFPTTLEGRPWRQGQLWTTDPAGAEHAGLLVVRPESPALDPAIEAGGHPVFEWL